MDGFAMNRGWGESTFTVFVRPITNAVNRFGSTRTLLKQTLQKIKLKSSMYDIPHVTGATVS